MKINHIEIENYRNIESLSLDFDDINIIYGENAQGKTNLIEVFIFIISSCLSATFNLNFTL